MTSVVIIIIYFIMGVLTTLIFDVTGAIDYGDKDKNMSPDNGDYGLGVLFWPLVLGWAVVKVFGLIVNKIVNA